jgi:hypothetical protein
MPLLCLNNPQVYKILAWNPKIDLLIKANIHEENA